MATTLVRNVLCKGHFNSYLVAGNVCNVFALGELGTSDDFFLIGAEPEGESNYPLLTGNILDSEGKVLFRLVKNMLVINPGHCSKILGNYIGYEIHDRNDQLIFKVQTRLECLPGGTTESFVTTISANFFDKNGNLVFHATSGGDDERIESSLKSNFGFTDEFVLVHRMSEDELTIARMMLGSGGAIHRVLTGSVSGKTVSLDGTMILNAQISKCTVQLSTCEFTIYGTANQFNNCHFEFSGTVAKIRDLIVRLMQSGGQ
ncbi:MAG: hypothetical protein WCH04_15340 [Gammaproteobacteria bacterium]